jgi:hypothetical protein
MKPNLQWTEKDGVFTASANGFEYSIISHIDGLGSSPLRINLKYGAFHLLDNSFYHLDLAKLVCTSHADAVQRAIDGAVKDAKSLSYDKGYHEAAGTIIL